jgi:hypothetical protein
MISKGVRGGGHPQQHGGCGGGGRHRGVFNRGRGGGRGRGPPCNVCGKTHGPSFQHGLFC